MDEMEEIPTGVLAFLVWMIIILAPVGVLAYVLYQLIVRGRNDTR